MKYKSKLFISWAKYQIGLLLIILVAIAIRIFVVEIYYIPSDSMNSTLYEGDVILVSKLSYGVLLPSSPAEIPLVSGFMYIKPVGRWLSGIHWPYRRTVGFAHPKRGDVLVFKQAQGNELLIKRCVAIPGDTLRLVHDSLYVNSRYQSLPDSARLYYRLQTKAKCYTDSELQKLFLRKDQLVETNPVGCIVSLTPHYAKCLSVRSEVKLLKQAEDTTTNRFHEYFPHKVSLRWNCSHYGPLVVPKKGVTVRLDTTTLAFYAQIIRDNEENKLELKGRIIYINGKRVVNYTFKMNYYFVMGDNRLNSLDSRFRGFIAEDKIISKASFILFSKEKDPWQKSGIRWERLMTEIR